MDDSPGACVGFEGMYWTADIIFGSSKHRRYGYCYLGSAGGMLIVQDLVMEIRMSRS